MPRILQQASQMSMLELSNVIQANNEEKKRMEAETDKLYNEYMRIYYWVQQKNDCKCRECDER